MKKSIILLIINIIYNVNYGVAQINCIEEIATITDNSSANGIAIKDQFLYVSFGPNRINIYDISNPENPILSGQQNFIGSFIARLNILDNHLYLYGNGDNNLTIYDITNPSSLVKLGTFQFPSSTTGISNAGHLTNYTYFTSSDTLHIVNTTNKSNPFIENKISSPGVDFLSLREIYITTEFLYIGSEDGILIYDNSTPSLPIFQSIYPNGKSKLAVDPINQLLYTVPNFGSGYTHYVSSIEDPFNPDLVFQGSGGNSSSGRLLANDEILLQTGSFAINSNEGISLYKIQDNSTVYIEDFLGSIQHSITDMEIRDSLIIISKNGGVEILKYNGCFTTSIDKTISNNQIKLHPNPIQDILTINFEDDFKGMKIEIIDGLGRSIFNRKVQNRNEKIDLKELNQGLYFVKFDLNGKYLMTKKILKK